MPDRTQSNRWIVQGEAVLSGALARHIEADPDVQRVAQIAPDVVVLTMTADRAQRLGLEVRGLIIEADTELEPQRPGSVHDRGSASA